MRRLLMAKMPVQGEDGAVAGVEVVPFAVLVFVVGTLLVANAWAVIDTKMAVTAASREAVRAFVEAPSGVASPHAIARDAALDAMTATGRGDGVVAVDVAGELRRCATVTVTVTARVPAVVVPWVGGLGTFTPRSTAAELVDPLRSGIVGEATCLAR